MQRLRRWLLAGVLVLAFSLTPRVQTAQTQPTKLPVPVVWRQDGFWISLRDAAKALSFQTSYVPEGKTIFITRGSKQVKTSVRAHGAWRAADGRLFVPVKLLGKLDYTVQRGDDPKHAVIAWDGHQGFIQREPRTIAVNLRRQVLSAREGDVLVYRWRVSTGKDGYNTPAGNYTVLRKEPLYISKTYPEPTGGAKMPYALWFAGGYYIHGFESVSHRPSSHGCIHLTVPQARTLFHWTPIGTPVHIYRTEQL